MIISMAGLMMLWAAQSPQAYASIMTIDTSYGEFTPGDLNQGWWSGTADNFDANNNYVVGDFGGDSYRNFFTFKLDNVNGVITSATLNLLRGTSDGSQFVYNLGSVTTDAATLNANDGHNAGIYNDLGSGTSFGSFSVSDNGNPTDLLSFNLNSAGLAAINASEGGYFSLGGSLNAQGNVITVDPFLFGSTNDGIAQELVLQVANPVPELPTVLLVGLGLVGAVLIKRTVKETAGAIE